MRLLWMSDEFLFYPIVKLTETSWESSGKTREKVETIKYLNNRETHNGGDY